MQARWLVGFAWLVACGSFDDRALQRRGTGGAPVVAGSNGAGSGAIAGDSSEPAGDAGEAGDAALAGSGGTLGRAGGAGTAGRAGSAGAGAPGSAGAAVGGSAASAGSVGSAAGSAGSGGTVGIGGSAGSSNDFPCGPLGPACGATLLQNSRFAADLEHWTAGPWLEQAWRADDALGQAGSGSIDLKNVAPTAPSAALSMAGTEQCIAVSGDASYQLAARVRIQSGQGVGEAGFNLWLFGSDACQGSFLSAETAITTTQAGSWLVINHTSKLPSAARSMVVRLVVSKPMTAQSFAASFDDVYVLQLP